MELKIEKIRRICFRISLITLGLSLLSPTYCTNVSCSDFGSGLEDLLGGWIGVIFYGHAFIAWFANPFLILAIITYKKSPDVCLILSLIALAFALQFLKGGKLQLNEAGHEGYVTEIQFGYWLWVFSMFALVVASLIALFSPFNEKSKQHDF